MKNHPLKSVETYIDQLRKWEMS